MRIGELARAADCKAVTVRFYEDKGLLGEATRSASNYRIYDEEDLERLLFVRNCRALGLTIKEISRLIKLQENPRMKCDDVNTLLDTHLIDIERQIEALRALQDQMKALRRRCNTPRLSAECGVLNALNVKQLDKKPSRKQ
jgi:Cd(II)/Pb(II)-responsive transcriptional regulator